MKAALVVSHGSHSPKTKEEVLVLLARLKKKSRIGIWEYAFLEIERPDIPEGIALCVQKGATDLAILLNFLNSGKHVDEDIPRIVREARERFPKVHIRLSAPVGQHPEITALFLDLLKQK